MKKTALILALALTASMATSASALSPNHTLGTSFVTHGASCNGNSKCAYFNWNHCEHWIVGGLTLDGLQGQELATHEVIECSENVRATFPKAQGVSEKWVTCKEAITEKELKTVCVANDIAHATVFRQRNVDKGGDLTALNWSTYKTNSTIILFRAEGSDEWTLLAQSETGVKTAEATLPGAGSYVVAMTW